MELASGVGWDSDEGGRLFRGHGVLVFSSMPEGGFLVTDIHEVFFCEVGFHKGAGDCKGGGARLRGTIVRVFVFLFG